MVAPLEFSCSPKGILSIGQENVLNEIMWERISLIGRVSEAIREEKLMESVDE